MPESLSVISSRPAATQLRNCRRSARARGRSESTMAATNTSRTGYASCTAWPRGLQRPVAASGWSTANQLAKNSEEAATAPSASMRAVPPTEPALVGTSQKPYAASGPHASVITSPTEGLGIDPATTTYPRAQAPSAAARNQRGRRIAASPDRADRIMKPSASDSAAACISAAIAVAGCAVTGAGLHDSVGAIG